MKALSIKQPWAWLICAGYKDIENRDWFIGRKPALGGRFQDRGLELPQRIYVHAGMSQSEMIPEVTLWIKDRLIELQCLRMAATLVNPGLYHGGIIGEVDITGCVEESDSPWFVGRYGFVLANPVLYDKPVPCRGQLGFFNVPEEVIHGQKV